MKRLVAVETNAIFSTTAKDGRAILQALEAWRYKLNQCQTMLGNNSNSDKALQDSNMIDTLMSGLYSICYNLENIDLTPLYDINQINMGEQSKPDNENDEYNLSEQEPLEEDIDLEPVIEEEKTENGEEDGNNEDNSEENDLNFDELLNE